MKRSVVYSTLFIFTLILCVDVKAQNNENPLYSEVSGYFAFDYRYFPEEGLYPGQKQEYFSSVFSPEILLEWQKGKQRLKFVGFGRIDQHDNQRTHADIRELYYQKIWKKIELSAGVKKIFWGVTESNHLVDFVNQTDVLEGFDLENKLGQPMVHLSYLPNWGTIDVMVMPYFREMQFPGMRGRLRPPFDASLIPVFYESEHEEYNPDIAVRYSNSKGVFDFGITNFYGTARQPIFIISSPTTFRTLYEVANQTGVDIQALTGSMLWKLEALHRESNRKTITAIIVGGEYTFSNMFRSGIDLGLIAEYNYDDRGEELISALDDDIFLGTRIAFNDKQSTDFIGGVIIDRNNQTQRYFAEANRRIGDSWKLSLKAFGYNNIDESEFLYLLRKDGYMEASLAKYF
ncbi:MAG: hypothetical protein HKN22_01385 [Bacteroidia bacterium]|nr:hypothetical protein [Bacteroidia bacterium]